MTQNYWMLNLHQFVVTCTFRVEILTINKPCSSPTIVVIVWKTPAFFAVILWSGSSLLLCWCNLLTAAALPLNPWTLTSGKCWEISPKHCSNTDRGINEWLTIPLLVTVARSADLAGKYIQRLGIAIRGLWSGSLCQLSHFRQRFWIINQQGSRLGRCVWLLPAAESTGSWTQRHLLHAHCRRLKAEQNVFFIHEH